MAEITYLDFDLRIEKTEGGYQGRVLESPAGEASRQFERPFSNLELENFYLRVSRPRQGVRRLDSPEMQLARSFGERLFRAIFDDELLACFSSSLATAQAQGKGLRLRLRLDAPELNDLPWEYLYNPNRGQFLAWSVHTPLVRYFELPQPPPALTIQPPLRVLVMISSPTDYPALDVEREWAQLKLAVQDQEGRGLISLERLDTASLAALQRRLRQGEVHVLHFIGHGKFSESERDGLLLFEDDDERGRPLSGSYLGALLGDHRPLRLVVLNACEGARSGQTDPYAGVAQSLVRQGIPAVIAMQFEITDEAAITFGREFYAALADNYPVDAALAEARKAIFAAGNDIEWGTPVYFTRAPSGRIFDLARPAPGATQSPLPAESARPAEAAVQPAAASPPASGFDLRRLASDRRVWWALGAVALMLILVFLGLNGPWGGESDLPTPTLPVALVDTATPTHTVLPPSDTPVPAVTHTPPASATASATASQPAAAPSHTPTHTPTVHTPEASPSPTSLPVEITDNFKVPMVLVPAGAFSMGRDAGLADERPARLVALEAYYIDQYEVTNARYYACVLAGACTPPAQERSRTRHSYFGTSRYQDYPVLYVTWEQAGKYCAWRDARLPSEAEWEKAARGTDGRLYPWGNQQDCRLANACGSSETDTARVGSYPDGISPYKIYDMAGNVWEWVQDWYDVYPGGSPLASSDFGQNSRVRRGGSWNSPMDYITSTVRGKARPDTADDITGLRCARPATGAYQPALAPATWFGGLPWLAFVFP